MSVIEIGVADDSLLQEEEEEDCNTGTLDLACSPLHLLPPPIPNQNDEVINQMKRRKKRGGFNLRKSLAWNNAFFTEEGVLNQQELSRLTTTIASRTKFLSGIPEQSLTSSSKDPKLIPRLSPSTSALASKVKPDLDPVKGVNKIFLRAGACPRPLGSASITQKRLPSPNLTNAPTKDLKIPKLSLSKSQQSSASGIGAKHSACNRNRPQGNLEKNAFPKGSSNTSKTTPSRIFSTSRSSGTNTTSKATSGLKMIPDPVPNVGTSTSKVVIPHPQNARGGKFTNAQIHATKPSGLRMPSPSLRYFSQPEAPTFLGVKSPRDIQSCNLREVSIPSQRKFGDSCHTGEIRPSDEPAGTMRMPEVGINAMKCLVASAATTNSYPSFKSNKEFKRSVVEILQVSPLVKSEREIDGADNSIEHQLGEETHRFSRSDILVDKDNGKAVTSEVLKSEEQEHTNSFSHDVEKVQHKENCISHSGRLVEQRTSEESIKDNDIENLKGNESKNNVLSKENDTIALRHSSISDSELQCELENAIQKGSIKKLQKDDHLESFIDVRRENEEFNASELEILQVPALLNSEMQSYSVSGADYLVEHKNAEEVHTSLKSSASVEEIDDRIPVVHSYCLEVGDELNTLLGEQEVHKKSILEQVENVQHEENHHPLNNNCGSIEQDSCFLKSLKDHDPVNSRCKGLKNNISSKYIETIDPSHSNVSDGEKNCELENSELPAEDKGAIIPLEGKSLEDSTHEAVLSKHKLNAAPFSDEWVAALEEVGEEILTRKTGAVQNSPPDKSLPEPGPWSPVKRKKILEIGPFDCTKYTNLPQHE